MWNNNLNTLSQFVAQIKAAKIKRIGKCSIKKVLWLIGKNLGFKKTQVIFLLDLCQGQLM
jgi:hypothetical protein